MYKSTSRNEQFQEKIGSYADRLSARGFGESNDPIQILSSLTQQVEALKERRANTHDSALLDDLTRQIGDLYRTIKNENRLAFETIFVHVAQGRLPKATFLIIVQEAREYWRKEGFAAFEPPPSPREANKIRKRQQKYSMLAKN